MGRAKPLSGAQLADMDSRLGRSMRQLARKDPAAWRAMPADQRYTEAAKAAMADVQAEAARKVENVQRQALKTAATNTRVEEAEGHTRSGKLTEDLFHTNDYVQGVKMDALSGLMNLMDAVKSTQGASIGRRVSMLLFGVQNPAMTRDLAREIYRNADGTSGNKIAQAGARAWLDTIGPMRERFNAAGGDIGKLDYGYLPQPHDSARVHQAGPEKWTSAILPLLDRSRYVDETGARLDDAGMRDMLGHVWETIATEGINKIEPGEFKGAGARANRGSQTRELHFTENGYLPYLSQYGRGSMYDAMTSHVGRLARDIGLVERYGPNPEAQMRLQLDQASKTDVKPLSELPRTFGVLPQTYWDLVSGKTAQAGSARIAEIGTHVRNVQTFGKLGAAVISSVTDLATYIQATGYNKLGYWRAISNIGRVAASGELRDMLTTHGIIAESMAGDLNRWTNDNIKATWSGRLANATLRLSLLNAWTDTMRRAFSLTMMQGLARLAGHDWEAMPQWDRAILERKGITAEDWGVIRQAQLTHFQGTDHLTPESIRATGHERSNEIVAKVLGLIQDVSEDAVINPDLPTKAISTWGGTQRGTVLGELARSVMQFKSFPLAMVTRHWAKMTDVPKVTDGSAPLLANRAMYAGTLMLTTTALGAIALEAKQILAGKDPIDVTNFHNGKGIATVGTKFWLKAVAQGGGLSIAGDMILNDPGTGTTSDLVKNTVGTLAGPTLSDATTLGLGIPTEAMWNAAKDRKGTAAADTIRAVRSNTPFVNLWYARAAMDHAGLQAVQENLSPGYLGRMQAAAQKDWGQRYWWKPGTGGPQRAPNLAAAVGD